MDSSLDETQREQCSVEELARIIFCFLKKVWNRDYIGLEWLREILCPKPPNENEDFYSRKNRSFFLKFYEAIARLKQRGLLMEANSQCFEDLTEGLHAVCLTSIGKESYLDDGILILIDDACELVQSLKDKAHNLDPVVEQYYLESLRTCQNESYISSVICLGAASERTINCLAEAVVLCNPACKHDIDSTHSISALTRYLLDYATQLFKSLDPTLRNELKEKLKGLASRYRINRNEAGHPSNVPQDWKRDEQECYLSQFRRLAATCFKAIDELNSASAGSMPGQKP